MVARYDVIVIGAGISGMYQLHRLRGLGLSVRVFEAGDGVGGTWYWNRYPGARFDSESWTYGYSFSDEILREWEWSEHFAAQPETLRYCNFVADKLDLRRDIEFGCRIKAAVYDEAAGEWEIESEDGRRARARFLITAIGPLSAPTMPTIPGVESFRGEAYHTGRWPHEPVSFERKRVAVIGTGGHPGPHQGHLSGDFCALPRVVRLLHSRRRPAQGPRGEPRGARGLLREALSRARLWHLDG